MSVLMVNDYAEFTHLKELLGVTDGNLASHIKALEKEGYIMIIKQYINKRPTTRYAKTPEGLIAFKKHLEALEKLLRT